VSLVPRSAGYVALLVVIGLMPFALLTVLSARLLRPGPRTPKLES
jgi:hypothetical protein